VGKASQRVGGERPRRLDRRSLAVGLAELTTLDRQLAAVLDKHGPPPLWARPPGYPTLVQIILEQQVSLALARAAFTRLEEKLGRVTPAGLLGLSDAELKQIGFSRQKARYGRELARDIVAGKFDVGGLARMADDEAREALMGRLGIGRWSADIYLLMALRRPDVWPKGDLALAKAVQQVKQLPELPDEDHLEGVAESWRPWRAVAARVLWHHYLSGD
jgi:DNA-3-methyladenine glycosylase II